MRWFEWAVGLALTALGAYVTIVIWWTVIRLLVKWI